MAAMPTSATGVFTVAMHPGATELDGAVGRFDLTKTFHGDLHGSSTGVMLSAGSPQTGSAGYVALEVFTGQLGDHRGVFALQQSGRMHQGSQVLHYDVVPGSGSGDLAGITGSMRLLDGDGEHRYELVYDLA